MLIHATPEKSNSLSFINRKKQQPFFSPVIIQPKLTIGPVDDPYEREADAMADKVMRLSDGETLQTKPSPINIQRKCAHCEEEEEEKLQRKEDNEDNQLLYRKPIADLPVQRKCAACEEEEKNIQPKRSTGGSVPAVTPFVNHVLQSSGHPLEMGTRSFMESRFGYDFSNVQIHNDTKAHQSSSEINALAYTHANHIVFGSEQYQPSTNTGKQLLAHELTHVLQQDENVDTKLIQKQTANSNNDPASGIETDPESFSIEAAKLYLLFERNKLEQHLYSTNCSTQTFIRECDVLSNNGIKLKVRWATDTNRVIVKSCIDNDCLSCGYDYTVDTNGDLVLNKIRCWPITGID